ncbi:hypothetical protein D9M68_873860 [compost metagenome]
MAGKTITLPAASLKGLIDARHKVETERQKHMKKDAKANSKKNAGAPVVGHDDESFEIADLCKG